MSFSFTVQAANMVDVFVNVKDELDEVVESQPVHEKDAASALEVASKYIGLLDNVEGNQIRCSVAGSIQSDSDGKVLGVSISVGAYSLPGQ
jgi:hypothetical protein